MSDYRIASGLEDGPRYFAYGKNLILLILHVVALLGPAMVARRHSVPSSARESSAWFERSMPGQRFGLTRLPPVSS